MSTIPSLPESVTLTAGKGGLPALKVRSPRAEAFIYLQGAHVAEWEPSGFDDVLWTSARSEYAPGRPIRGGVPLCAPWFGPGLDGHRVPPHGWFRLHEWQVLSATDTDGVVEIVFALDGETAHAPGLRAEYLVRFSEQLDMELTLTASRTTVIEEALHTYLAVGDVNQISIEGLNGAVYLDKVTGQDNMTQTGTLTFTGPTDRVYTSSGPVRVIDPVKERVVTVTKENSANTVVWNPWSIKAETMPDFGDHEWPHMVCVEVANAVGGAVELSEKQPHTMKATYAVENL